MFTESPPKELHATSQTRPANIEPTKIITPLAVISDAEIASIMATKPITLDTFLSTLFTALQL
jgi:hypothetical protein